MEVENEKLLSLKNFDYSRKAASLDGAFLLSGGGYLAAAVKSGIVSALAYYRQKPEFSEVIHEFESLSHIDRWTEDKIRSSGYVLHTLQASLWCLLTTSSYPECVLKAVNLGDDTDTVGVISGALAGFWYGEAQIPGDWKEKTVKFEAIWKRAEEFYWACVKEQK